MPLDIQSESTEFAPGTNLSATTIPEARVCGYGSSSAYLNPITNIAASGAAKARGFTRRAIAPGQTGDVCIEGPGLIETDGSGTVERGDQLVVNVTPGANEGRVFSIRASPPAAGATVRVVGVADDAAPASVTRIRAHPVHGVTYTRPA